MDSRFPPLLRNDNISLSLFPAELITRIFCFLPSFSDVFALAHTSQKFRRIWVENPTSIYNQVAPKSLSCERYARAFYSDQGGPILGKPLSAQDVFCMVRNSRIIEKAIAQFEEEIVYRVRVRPYDRAESYGPRPPPGKRVPGSYGHPPHMTPSERVRFIRMYYQVWGLMKLEPTDWQARLDTIRLQDLFFLFEVSRLNQSIGLEEVLGPIVNPSGSFWAVYPRPSGKRNALSELICKHLKQTYERCLYRELDHDFWSTSYKLEGGYMNFRTIWDHWQFDMRGMLRTGSLPYWNGIPNPKVNFFYDDSLDKEFQE